MRVRLRLWVVIAAFICLCPPALAAAPAKPAFNEKAVGDFYRGKTVRIIVGFSAGGGYDQYSRLIARHISKYIPGNPAIIVDNMPGAGSIIAANHTFNRSEEHTSELQSR